jgi:hypothetical protein
MESNATTGPPIAPESTSSSAVTPRAADVALARETSPTHNMRATNSAPLLNGHSDSESSESGSEHHWEREVFRARQIYLQHQDSPGPEHDMLGVMIELVQTLVSPHLSHHMAFLIYFQGLQLQKFARDQADLETQLTLAKSNLQLALANTEMLEDALRDRGATRDVGWRRSRPPGDLEAPNLSNVPKSAPPSSPLPAPVSS